MAHLRSSRNISNLQVGSLRYDKSEVPPYGGILAVDTTGKVDITDEVRLRNLNVIDSVVVGTTLQVNGTLTAGTAYVNDALTVAGDATFLSDVSMGGPLTVAQHALFLSDVSVNGEIDISGTLTVAQEATFLSDVSVNGNVNIENNLTAGNDITAFRVRATYIDSSGIIYGDDIDLSGNLQVDGWSELVGAVTMYGGLQVTGGTTLNNSLYSDGLGTFNAGLQVTGGTTLNNSLYSGGLGTFNAGLQVTGGTTLNNSLYSDGLGTFNAGLQVTGGGTTVASSLYAGGLAIFAAGVSVLGSETVSANLIVGGNVGVGTTTPATVVQVNNPTQTAITGLAVRSGAVNTTIGNYTGPNGALANYGSIQTTDVGGATTIGTNPYPLVLQPLGGRVGIGGAEYNAIANTEQLQVAGNVLVRAGAGITTGIGYSTSYITLNNANAATTNQQTLTVSMDSSGNAMLNTAAVGTATVPNLVLQTGDIERARVTNSGFTVAGDILGQNISLTGSVGTTYLNGQGAYLSWNNDGFNGQTYLVNQRGIGTGGFRFQIFDSSNTFVKEPLSVTNIANVANTTITQTDIATGATTTNTAALVVQNASGGTHTVSIYTNMYGGAYNGLTQTGDKGIIFSNGTVDSGNLVIGPWRNGGTSAGLRIDASGQVGIGTASPGAALDVIGTTPYAGMTTANPFPSSLILRTTTGTEKLMMGAYYTGGQGSIGAIQASDYYSSAEHPNTLALNPLGGNVGIGTITPAYTLDVNGSARISGNLYTSIPAFLAYANATQTLPNSGIAYRVIFNGENYDENNNYDSINSRFVAPIKGIYHFDAIVSITAGGYMSPCGVFLQITDSSDIPILLLFGSNLTIGSAFNQFAPVVSSTVKLNASDRVYVYAGAGGGTANHTINSGTAGSHTTSFGGYLVKALP